jgi:hypothetical protein
MDVLAICAISGEEEPGEHRRPQDTDHVRERHVAELEEPEPLSAIFHGTPEGLSQERREKPGEPVPSAAVGEDEALRAVTVG